ncbi:MAG TPA: hypothetical protein VJH97_01240 [Candidatus Nanoarchaeia archaeon]|nr:hypothetical protein [Candidatus Nanoarchaeia archaeon]
MESPRFIFRVLFAVFASFSILMAGCTTTVPDTVTEVPPIAEDINDSIEDLDEPAVVIEREDPTATDADKQDEQLEQLIADGQYKEVIQYTTPGGPENLEIDIVVKDDAVESVALKGIKPKEISLKMQTAVNTALQDLVVGKNVADIDLPDHISGSSLTSVAFKNHLQDLIDAN